MILPKEIETLIFDYKYQIEHHEKKQKVISEIKKIKIYHIAVCLHCRRTEIIDSNNENDINNNCNHFFYLAKSVYYLYELKLFKYGLFDFFCHLCNSYDGFFSHIHPH